MCVLSSWHHTNAKVDTEVKPPCKACTHGGELHSHVWHHLLPILFVVASFPTGFLALSFTI